MPAPGPAFPLDLVSPGSRVLDGPVTLGWQPLETAADSWSYEVEVARELAGLLDTVRVTRGAPSYTADLGPGAYRWRVRGVRTGLRTAWSATAAFAIDRARADFGVRWTLPTDSYEPDTTYVLEPNVPFSLLGRLDALGLDDDLVLGLRIEGLELAFVQPLGAPLDAFADYQIFPQAGGVIASLLEPPAAPRAPMDILYDVLPEELLSTSVRYRLRTATTATVPPGSPYVLEATGDVVFFLDVRTSVGS